VERLYSSAVNQMFQANFEQLSKVFRNQSKSNFLKGFPFEAAIKIVTGDIFELDAV